MANVARAEEQTAPQGEAHEKDAPLLDLSDAAVKRLMKTAKSRGFVTLDQLNAVLPSQEVSPDQIEDTMSMLSDMGITVVESEDAEEGSADRDTDEADDAEDSARSLVAPSLPAASATRDAQKLELHRHRAVVDRRRGRGSHRDRVGRRISMACARSPRRDIAPASRRVNLR